MPQRFSFNPLWLAIITMLVFPRMVIGCPFCSSVRMTFSEEINNSDVALFARLMEMPPKDDADDPNSATLNTAVSQNAKFEIIEIVRGAEHMGDVDQIEVLYYGEPAVGQLFLLFGLEAPNISWTTPIPISDRIQQYVTAIVKLPKSGTDRLQFFLEYLEDEEEMLAADAYDEFARVPYKVVQGLKDQLSHDQLIAFIQNKDIPPSRRRLYLVMLGVCGNPEDAPLLEAMIRSDDKMVKAGLDAMIGCYLTLLGEEGLPLIEELFLKNKEAEYTDTYSAIMALRFHAGEGEVIDRARIVGAMRHMLERPQLADLVIPDLARWGDWESMPRMVELFKQADEESSWVRVPVVNYLRACPLAEAKVALDQLAEIDPDSVKRAMTFFPPGVQEADEQEVAESSVTDESVSSTGPSETPTPEQTNSEKITTANQLPETTESGDSEGQSSEKPGSDETTTTEIASGSDQEVETSAEHATTSEVQPQSEESELSLGTILGVPLIAGLLLLVLLWVILRSSHHQVST